MNGKYYWLKLKKDFFKRHDIKFLESMSDGQLSVLFYLKLMLESIDHEGELRFSDKVAYSPEMLAAITDTDIEVVKVSLGYLTQLGMIEINQDGTIIIDKVKTMIGCASDTDEARRSRRYREKKKAERDGKSQSALQNVTASVTERRDKRDETSREIESEIEIDTEIDSKEKSIKEKAKPDKHFVTPTVEEVRAYCQERNNGIDPETFVSFYEAKGWFIGKNKMKDWKAAVRTWERQRKQAPVTAISNPVSGNPFTALKHQEGYD